MTFKEKDKNIILSDYKDFDIEETLECGQCFRFEKLDEKEYLVIAFNKELHIKQKNDEMIFYNTTADDFENIWINYFDLNRDYSEIKKILSEKDETLKEAIAFAGGIRILNQDPWECLISFIISQNNRIPMIKQVIKNISEKYGDKIDNYYSFPSHEKLLNVKEEELKLCKTGFRAKYILDATEKIASKEIDFEEMKNLSTDELREKLMMIKGVGPKVSDCVMLFSLNKEDAFPTDVWVKRVMQYFYFDNQDTNIKKIHEFAKERFGNLAGFAQQYLFHYARIKKIGA